MRNLIVWIAGLLGIVAGWIAAAAVALGIASLLGVPDREGGPAMMAFFALGPVGGFLGLVAGVWFVLHRWGRGGVAAVAMHSGAALLLAALLSAVTTGVLWLNRPQVTSNALPPSLMFEIRLPKGASPPALVSRSEAHARRSPIELQTPENTMSAEIESLREDGGRPVIAGRVEMYYRTKERLLVLKQPDGDVVFRILLDAAPVDSPDFGAWQSPLPIAGATPATSEPGPEIRYRAMWQGRE